MVLVNKLRPLESSEITTDEKVDGLFKTVPGKSPKTANGKLAVEAAWELECKLSYHPSDKEVMALLIDWANNGKKPDILKAPGKDGRSVEWITSKRVEKNYSIEALQRTLETWEKSRG